MRAYLAIVSARFRMLLQYRAAAVAGFATQLFWGFIRLMIYEAFYRRSDAPQPMRLDEVVTYIWLGQATLAMLPWNTDADIRMMVRNGTVAYEMVRPLDLYNLWYCRAIATRTAPTLLRAVPMFLLAIPFFGMRLPPSFACAAAWIVATLGALLLGCALSTLLNISLLWTISGEGVARVVPAAVIIFSGLVIPLPLFPDWAQSLLNFLPFRGLMDAPFRVYMGHIPPSAFLGVFAHQIAWTVALVALGRAILARGVRRLVVQGG